MSAVRIVVFIHSLAGGGAERCVARLLEQWQALHPAFELHLVLNKARFAYALPASVHVHVIGCERASTFGKMIDQFVRLRRAVSLLNAVRPQAVLAVMPWSNLLALLARALSSVRPRLVLSEHTSYTSPTERKLRVGILRLLMRHLYPRADALVAVSQTQAADLQRAGRWRDTFATVIQNGVDPRELQALADQTAAPHPWLASQRDCPTAVFAGRLESVKGIDVLLRAWERVLARTSARLLIVGSGSQRDALQAQARALPDAGASVAFVPFQANPFPFIGQADVFVLPSRKEGFPIVLLEAMALGRACVATDCPTGPRELVGENEHGLLVPPQDPDSLAEALMHALSEPTLRARLGASARMRAAQLSAHSTAQRYLDVLLPEGLADTTGLRS